jgi:hypothetical protein
VASTWGTADWTPNEMRVKPPSRSSASDAGVTLSGFASVVTSASGSSPKVERRASSIRTRSADGSWVGVPPPKNTVSTVGRPPLWARERAASSISVMAVSAYDSRVAPSPSSSAV